MEILWCRLTVALVSLFYAEFLQRVTIEWDRDAINANHAFLVGDGLYRALVHGQRRAFFRVRVL